MSQGITLAMIVRNEAENLARCLHSARDAVDEIVIVDTGSSDDTLDVAKRFGARTVSIEWPDDFSAARNVSLDLVQTEWVLVLDGDEWLAEDSARRILEAVQINGAFGFLLTRQDLFPDGGHSEQQMLRLWRHHPAISFAGVIHEHLDLDALSRSFPGRKLLNADIRLWHDGYTEELTPQKAARNLPLLERELARVPDSYYIALERAATLKALGSPEWRDAERAIAERVLALRDSDQPPDNTAALFFMRRFANLDDEEIREAETDQLLRLARGWFSDHPGVLYMCAQIEIRRQELRRALADLLEVERMAQTGDFDRLTTTAPAVLGIGLSTNLALVAHQLGRTDIAVRHYRRLLTLDPNNAIARQNLALI